MRHIPSENVHDAFPHRAAHCNGFSACGCQLPCAGRWRQRRGCHVVERCPFHCDGFALAHAAGCGDAQRVGQVGQRLAERRSAADDQMSARGNPRQQRLLLRGAQVGGGDAVEQQHVDDIPGHRRFGQAGEVRQPDQRIQLGHLSARERLSCVNQRNGAACLESPASGEARLLLYPFVILQGDGGDGVVADEERQPVLLVRMGWQFECLAVRHLILRVTDDEITAPVRAFVAQDDARLRPPTVPHVPLPCRDYLQRERAIVRRLRTKRQLARRQHRAQHAQEHESYESSQKS